METAVISDTSCLVVLEKIGQLSLLKASYDQVLVTPIVAEEFGAQLPDWIIVRAAGPNSLQKLLEETIDPGEASSIALAAELKDCYLILDDLRARKVASTLGLSFTGTLGFLASAKRRSLIPLLRPIFEEIRKTDFRISSQLFQEILRDLGE